MAASVDQQLVSCPLLIQHNLPGGAVQQQQLQKDLDSKDIKVKQEALKQIILLMSTGEQLPRLLMPVFKSCLNVDDHGLSKLLLFYWEIVPKKNEDGTLLHEMILVCNALKKNLNHPNEFIRGSTLRFMCKLQEPEILQPLIPSIIECLEHRHSYVRKSAVLAIFSIFQSNPELIPDGPEVVERRLREDSNESVRRNAFAMLAHCDQARALGFLDSVKEDILSFDELFQLAVLECIRLICRSTANKAGVLLPPTAMMAKYAKLVHTLCTNSTGTVSDAVVFDAATTLVTLSPAPTAVRATVSAYCQLLSSQSDNNVKLVILDRLASLRRTNEKILQEMLMSILRTLSSPNLEIRRQTLDLAMQLLSPRNVQDVTSLLTKEMVASDREQQKELAAQSSGGSRGGAAAGDSPAVAYRKLLMGALHRCAVNFPEMTLPVVGTVLEYLSDSAEVLALEVVHFVREVVHKFPGLRTQILQKLVGALGQIKCASVLRVALWVLGEYASSPVTIGAALAEIFRLVGPLPLAPEAPAPPEEQKEDSAEQAKATAAAPAKPKIRMPRILADGTYAASGFDDEEEESAGASGAALSGSGAEAALTNLRQLLLAEDFYMATALSHALTKLVLQYAQAPRAVPAQLNRYSAVTIHVLASLLRLGQEAARKTALASGRAGAAAAAAAAGSGLAGDSSELRQLRQHGDGPLDLDSYHHIVMCIRILMNPQSPSRQLFLGQSKEVLARLLAHQAAAGASPSTSLSTPSGAAAGKVEVDSVLQLRQLKGSGASEAAYSVEDDQADIRRALGASELSRRAESASNRIHQLTGFGDPVYAEAQLTVVDCNISLDIMVVNQTPNTLQNVTVELHTSGDLRLTERPQASSIPAFGAMRCRASVKVSCTESGVIFGTISWDSASGQVKSLVTCNNIHMDVMDYIQPAYTTESEFREMWAEFIWENKVAVNTEITELDLFLKHILSITNMANLTPEATLVGDCNFLAANLYARSLFGEDALLNVSVEKQVGPDGRAKIGGYMRIRSKTEGIALSLGDKLLAKQRSLD